MMIGYARIGGLEMIQKLLFFMTLFYFSFSLQTFAHGTGEETAQSIGIWVYAFSSLFVLALIGFIYAFILKKQVTKRMWGENRKRSDA